MPAERKPGPGWSKTKEGDWAPHWFTFDDFPGAQAIAVVFKILAIVVLAAGAISVVEAARTLHRNGVHSGEEVAVVAGLVAGTIIAASTMAFFAYVLELLTTIHFDTRFSDAVKNSSP